MPVEDFGTPEQSIVRLSGDLADLEVWPKAAIIEEGLSQITRIVIDVLAKDRKMKMTDLLGKKVCLEIDGPNEQIRKFRGICISAEYLADVDRFALIRIEVNPWIWHLQQRQDCRVFLEKSTPDVIRAVLTDAGFSGSFDLQLSATYAPRSICVQYRESDYAFISRLMEEEGIYFYFNHSGDVERLVMLDSSGPHKPSAAGTISYFESEPEYRRETDHIFEWTAQDQATFGKVLLRGYDFEKPALDLRSPKLISSDSNPGKDLEVYDFPGSFVTPAEGTHLSRIRMEAEAVRANRSKATTNVRLLQVGETFKLKDHKRDEDKEFMVTRATTYINAESDFLTEPPSISIQKMCLDVSATGKDMFLSTIEVIPKTVQYRPPRVTPCPEISGIQTALVVGPSGQEIHTDKYGRVKVQFQWDRLGKKDDKSSCWVRTMMPWTGEGWGMIAIPRVGQEVVVQFEEGNPDRPVVTGMLYNGTHLPPYGLPDNQTQTGIKTNSTPGGNGFNELRFEDKKNAEEIFIQAEKNFTQIVKNDAKISVGTEPKSTGNMALTVHKDLTETIETGDHIIKVEQGKTDLTIQKDYSTTIKQGNLSEAIKMGNHTTTLDMGDYKIDVKLGKVEIKAMQSITLTVGTNSIKIDPSGVQIKGAIVKIAGEAMLEAKSPVTQVKGDVTLILKGGVTMIN